MTISEAISKWLAEYDGIVVDTNHVSDGSDQYGLFKSPQRNIVSHVAFTVSVVRHRRHALSCLCSNGREVVDNVADAIEQLLVEDFAS